MRTVQKAALFQPFVAPPAAAHLVTLRSAPNLCILLLFNPLGFLTKCKLRRSDRVGGRQLRANTARTV